MILIAILTSTIALVTLAGLTLATGQTWLIPSMAASAALIVGAPQLPLSQPRNVIGGQTVSAVVGIAVGLLGNSLWLAAVAGGLALGAMMFLRMAHSPAAATAVIGVSAAGSGWQFIVLAACSAVVLVTIGLVGNKLLGNKLGGAKYPIYLW